jgi:exodeoxyribonuclease V alpha subunit
VIRDNPYCLTDIWGVPFVLADTIALENGIEKDNSKRLEGGLRQVMKESVSEGHAYLPFDTLRTKAMDLLGVDGDKIRQTMVNMVLKTGSLCNEGRNIYLPEMLLVENNLASRLFELNVPPMELEEYSIEASVPGFEPMQKQAIENMIRYPVSILTGGPGTGKTTTIKEMVGILKKNDLRVALAAPTGRAAKRMAELTGFKAKTIHRLLRYRPSGSFAVNRNNPLRYDAVIVDECSMMDINLAQALMQAIIPGTRIVFVGDVDQLPSVGPGNVLRDIIDSQIFPTVRLTQVHRQALQSMIVTNSHRVNNGEEPICNNGDFYFIPSDEENIPKKVAELVSRRLPGYSGLSSQDIQVLCPTRRMKDSINILLQEELNNGERVNSVLKTGDKIMQLVNDYDKGVFNGDLGTIMGYNKETGEATIRFEDSDVLYSLEDLDEIEPAYAVTIHKSQGSEYPVVILTLGPSDRGMLQRNLLYTALTRARKLLVIVGSRDAVSQCVQNNRQSRRNSALTQKIKKVFGQAE